MKKFLGGLIAIAFVISFGSVVQAGDKVVVCHAAGRADTTQFVTLEVPPNEGGFPQGHFTEDGTAEAGHEADYLGQCIVEVTPSPSSIATPSPSPTTPTITPTPSPTPAVTPTPTPVVTPSPTPTAEVTPSPSFIPTPEPTFTSPPSPTASLPPTDTQADSWVDSYRALMVVVAGLILLSAGAFVWLAFKDRS